METNSKIRFLEDLHNLVLSFSLKSEACNEKILGGVGFPSLRGFLEKKAIANIRRMVASLVIPTSNFGKEITNDIEYLN